MAADDWKLNDPEYAVEKFYTSSVDRMGHSAFAKLRYPTYLQSLLESLIASREIPDYKTVSDIFRDALYHRLRYIQKFSPTLEKSPALALAIRQAEEMRSEEQLLVVLNSLDESSKTVQSLLRYGLEDRARGLVERLVRGADGLPPDVRVVYMREVHSRFSQYLPPVEGDQEKRE